MFTTFFVIFPVLIGNNIVIYSIYVGNLFIFSSMDEYQLLKCSTKNAPTTRNVIHITIIRFNNNFYKNSNDLIVNWQFYN